MEEREAGEIVGGGNCPLSVFSLRALVQGTEIHHLTKLSKTTFAF